MSWVLNKVVKHKSQINYWNVDMLIHMCKYLSTVWDFAYLLSICAFQWYVKIQFLVTNFDMFDKAVKDLNQPFSDAML